MLEQDADVYKLAVTAHNPDDMVRVLKLQQAAPEADSRVLHGRHRPAKPVPGAEVRGAVDLRRVQQGTRHRSRSAEPGRVQDNLSDSVNQRRRRAFSASLGDPVGHSLSPLLHNQIYKMLGVNALYLPFRVPRGLLPQAVEAYESIPVQGYSVTIPHKEAAAQLAREKELNVEVTQAGEHAGATARRQVPGRQHRLLRGGRFTQGPPGRTAPAAGRSRSCSQLSVMLLGAGGVARAVAFALHREGAQLTITGRTYERAQGWPRR